MRDREEIGAVQGSAFFVWGDVRALIFRGRSVVMLLLDGGEDGKRRKMIRS